VQPLWLDDLEAIAQDAQTRRILLRMAALSRTGRTSSFLREVERDGDLDDDTKREVAALAADEPFLQAVEEHLGRSEMGDPGFEPGTSALSERRSNQLS
jgi:hypothetical protein